MKKKRALSQSRDPNNEYKIFESKVTPATREDLERQERESKKPKIKHHPIIPVLGGDQND